MKKLLVVAFIAILTIGIVFANGAAESDPASWAKTVDVVVPAKAGGGTDLAARSIFGAVAKLEGNSIGIVNNDSGNCVVAFEEVRNAEPDGSKILYFNSGFLTRVASGIYNHTLDDFKIIAISCGADPAYGIMVAADSGIETIEDLKAKAAAAPGSVLFGCNMGGTTQVAGNKLADALGVEFKMVHSGSDTSCLTELVGGSIDVCFANVNQAKQYAESGKARCLAVVSQTSESRVSPVMPQYPNIKDLGYDVEFATYMICLGPKDMTDELARKINGYIVEANKDPEVIKLLEPAGLTGVVVPYDEAEAILQEEQQKYVEAFAK